MSRYRLYPSPEQASCGTCAHARYVWNLAWNLHQFGTLETYGKASRWVDRDRNDTYHKREGGRSRPLPGYVEQGRMLTEARTEYAWLAAGSANVQQQALRDFDQAEELLRWHPRRVGRRKRYVNEGFRITDFIFGMHVRAGTWQPSPA